ncbi:hypothetical protein IWZ01DRAFT_487491 [Phyllosticta capitalensis]
MASLLARLWARDSWGAWFCHIRRACRWRARDSGAAFDVGATTGPRRALDSFTTSEVGRGRWATTNSTHLRRLKLDEDGGLRRTRLIRYVRRS